MWAPILQIEACRKCGTTERKHRARGLCNACLCKERYTGKGLSWYQKRVVSLGVLTELELAYISGLIDGDGTITAERPGLDNKGRWKAPRVRVMMALTDEPTIGWLHKKLGGTIYIKPARGNHKASFNWTLNGKVGVLLLQRLLPYLHIKHQRAEVAIKFGLIRMGARHPRSPEELKQLNDLKDKLLILNKRGVE